MQSARPLDCIAGFDSDPPQAIPHRLARGGGEGDMQARPDLAKYQGFRLHGRAKHIRTAHDGAEADD